MLLQQQFDCMPLIILVGMGTNNHRLDRKGSSEAVVKCNIRYNPSIGAVHKANFLAGSGIPFVRLGGAIAQSNNSILRFLFKTFMLLKRAASVKKGRQCRG